MHTFAFTRISAMRLYVNTAAAVVHTLWSFPTLLVVAATSVAVFLPNSAAVCPAFSNFQGFV